MSFCINAIQKGVQVSFFPEPFLLMCLFFMPEVIAKLLKRHAFTLYRWLKPAATIASGYEG